jgi:hypothetical protein
MISPSVMESVGHSGTHAPQEMHSSVIFIAIFIAPVNNFIMQPACWGTDDVTSSYSPA